MESHKHCTITNGVLPHSSPLHLSFEAYRFQLNAFSSKTQIAGQRSPSSVVHVSRKNPEARSLYLASDCSQVVHHSVLRRTVQRKFLILPSRPDTRRHDAPLPLGGDHGMLHFVIQSHAVNRTSTKYHSSHNIGREINTAVSQHLGPLIPQGKQLVSTIARGFCASRSTTHPV